MKEYVSSLVITFTTGEVVHYEDVYMTRTIMDLYIDDVNGWDCLVIPIRSILHYSYSKEGNVKGQ